MSRALWPLAALLALGAVLLWWRTHASREELLPPGSAAPDFALFDARGALHRLADYRGGYLLVYFYPRADTPGCTREACNFRDGYAELRGRGVHVVGISVDRPEALRAFADKYRLPFPLLSDPDGEVACRYDALWSLGPLRFAKRHSFLIDAQGRVLQVYRSVDADTHYREVLEDLARLAPDGV